MLSFIPTGYHAYIKIADRTKEINEEDSSKEKVVAEMGDNLRLSSGEGGHKRFGLNFTQ